MYDAADADCDVYAATAKMLLMALALSHCSASPPREERLFTAAGCEQALALKLLYLSVFVLRCRAGDPPAPRQQGGASCGRACTARHPATNSSSLPPFCSAR